MAKDDRRDETEEDVPATGGDDIPKGAGAVVMPDAATLEAGALAEGVELAHEPEVEDRSSTDGEQPLELEADEPAEPEAPEPEEAAAKEEAAEKAAGRFFEMPAASSGGAPRWAKIPKGMKFPRGRQVVFLRFPAEWTDTPGMGHTMPGETGKWRQCIVWALSDADEKHALNRSMGDVNRAPGQLAKQMIRAVDGFEVDWTGTPSQGNIDRWWSEIGSRCRGQIIRLYTQLHVLGKKEQAFFFESCVAVRSTG